jgi:predicted nuclease of predicted toxin-antitoxin system
MRFKIDENLHDEVAALFAGEGHDAETVHTEGLRGSDDLNIAQHCQSEDRAIVTLDLDFADLRAFPPAGTPGIIVLRVRNQSRQHVLNVLSHALEVLKREPLAGRLWIVSESSVRIREV